jgi:hypothetical protein
VSIFHRKRADSANPNRASEVYPRNLGCHLRQQIGCARSEAGLPFLVPWEIDGSEVRLTPVQWIAFRTAAISD